MSFSDDTVEFFALKCFLQSTKKPNIEDFRKWVQGSEFSGLKNDLRHAVFQDWKSQK